MSGAKTSALTLPREVKLADGSEITLRLLGRLDREALLRVHDGTARPRPAVPADGHHESGCHRRLAG